MLAIHPSSSSHPQKCTPNLLPARIHHNGPINDTPRYWAPATDEKGTQHTHFRGRHLHGTCIPLPETHTGAILRVTEKTVPVGRGRGRHDRDEEDGDEDGEEGEGMEEEEEEEEVKIAEQIGSFEEIVVWEHGGKVDEERDGFVRGMREWVGWAGSMHAEEEEGDEGKGTGRGKKD